MKKDNAYLRHILDETGNLEDFLRGAAADEFRKSREKQYAVLKSLEIIGEAAKNLSRELRNSHPEIPWKK